MEIELDKSFKERVLHAVLFEVTANVIIALSLAWLMNVSVLQSGSLSVISALAATAWNFVFNKFFDALQKKYAFQRTFFVRAIHAVCFETGLIITLIPVAMVMLNLTVTEAFFVEIGLVLFFLPYTMLFNWLYDYLRWTFVGRKRSAI
ncbi:PACE efflux transporter [Enterobacter cloacae]|uniref:PACE efflux transporter n=1 Tax=Enterobacter cloacae TaxID=550 RepID=UPI0011E78A39|nr:PACE efflux transporter [Enterobacter cloacae]MBF4155581.1 PACE efflux transporter [Enterobacter cloacae]MCK7173203.1 PACE efflux transporter [Enterobacter cloacae]MCU6411164.1 PACE efflux transporter [Enterobacter cloacae]MDQ7212917.1 PACE efflux transporter [Enterobacter cloacae]TYR23226.1 PACE efflux transporter [Enterobacter cloacae]